MADQISSLSIEISSDAKRATDALDSLISKLSGLNTALGSVNSDGLNRLSQGVTNLTGAIAGFKNVGATKTTFSAAANGLKAMTDVDPGKLSGVATAIQTLSTGVSSFSGTNDNVAQIGKTASALTKLSQIDVSKFATNLATIAPQLSSLSTAAGSIQLDGFEGSIKRLSMLATSLQKLGTLDVNNLSQSVSSLTPILQQFASAVSGLQIDEGKAQTIIGLANAINTLKAVTASGLAQSLNVANSAVQQFQNSTRQASIASQIFAGVVGGALVGSMRLVANATMSALQSVGTFAKNHLPLLGQRAESVRPKIQSLGFALWKLYAQLLLLRRILQVLSKPIEIASSLTEIQNVVNHTFGDMQYKLKDFAKTSIEQYGLSELSAKRYSSRFQAMGMAMGITGGMVSNASDNLTKMGATLNSTGNSLADMSINLTKLTGDLASFYDEDQAVVAEKLNSVFTGMARPLRAYGIDLTQATLQEWALKNGIDANVQSMSQAEKTMLRYQYVMANTQNIAGDFARTSDTWANQIRQLKQNFEALGATMGGAIINALKPIVKALNSAIKAVTGFAKVVSDALGFIFGWKYEEGSGGLSGIDDALADAADSAGGVDKGMGGAADKAKKLKTYLLGIDELNVLEPDDDSGSGGGGSGGGGGGGGASGAEANGGRWTESESIWKNFTSDIDSLFKLGRYISDTLAAAMESINWDAIYEKARNFGTGLASFLNGLITPRLFIALGHTIAGAINTALNFLDSFGETFDFSNFGNSIEEGIKACLEGIDWDVAFSAAENWGEGLASFLNELITPELFDDVGVTIGNALNTALTFLDSFGTTFDWTNFGTSIGTGIDTFFKTFNFNLAVDTFVNLANGVMTSITTAVSTVSWDQVGKTLAEGVNRIPIGDMIINFATMLGTVVKSGHTLMLSFIQTLDWVGLGHSLTTGFLTGFLNIDWMNIIINSTVHLPMLFLWSLQTAMWAAISEFASWLNEHFGFIGGVAGQAFLDGISKHFDEKALGRQEFIDRYIDRIRGQVGDGDANTGMGHTGQGAGHSFSAGFASEAEKSEAPITAVKSYVEKMRSQVEAQSGDIQASGKLIADSLGTGITSNSSTSETAMKELATKLYTGLTTGNGADGVNATTYSTVAKDAMNGFNTSMSSTYTETQAPTETWAKGIITWFTGNGAGEDKINKVAFTKFANDIITAFKDTITSNFEQTKEPMDAWVKGLVAWFTGESGNDEGFINQATWQKFAETVVEAFKTTIQAKYTETQTPLETWAKSMVRWINFGEESISPESGLGKKFYDIGENAMQGLINGLKSKLSELEEVCEQIASAMEDAMEAATEEHSPSKSWARIGSFLTEGLAVGMRRSMKLATDTATAVANAVDDAYKPFMPSYSSGAYGLPSAGGNIDSEGITNGLTAVITGAMNSSSDTALMQQQNEILTRIANKNTNVYMDGKKTDQLLKQAQRRSGFSFRPQLGNA